MSSIPVQVISQRNIEPDIASWLALDLIDGLGDESMRCLLATFGSPAAILSASMTSLERVVKRKVADNIIGGADPQKLNASLKWLEDPQNSVITLADPDYPALLLHIPDPPPLLYVKGKRALLNAPMLAIVGSRNATPQGLSNAEAFAEAASNAGFSIASGMALGIDAAAHRGGLRGRASSIAVVGTGLDLVYPASHRKLAHELAERGALVSEFPLGTPPIGSNFPRRNRIISGLSRGCLVVEAALQSGSLITARQALEQGREVFAIPGSIHSPLSRGCHALIKQGAKLVESAGDILEEFGCPSGIPILVPEGGEAAREEFLLLKHLSHDIIDVDTLCLRSGLTVETVSAMLLTLELDGIIASLPGGRYQRLR
ncbi:DNA protecting protein DprA [Nitrosospira multiformis ATCC 25196]|uniref:DNA protecting protein DprA n=1 Tax=Nitrosospira multiformis (strain ATCC 25196 / NCIMB 11849 / C 71) TaxID=323848 RepID=Q2YC18_NITMU|nr:DNA-processing protein DprA [Nitrosospira multiformis]ABB73703.1 DNA protecting protein DprA [Nitrosospira multiformis ATCC 25196]SEF40185.1 DNA protecting protein DprA [Nitrosospira multiformis ATCC 25196]